MLSLRNLTIQLLAKYFGIYFQISLIFSSLTLIYFYIRCHWNIPEYEIKDDSKAKVVKEGPVPWCRSDQLTFVSEQVSHHPPSMKIIFFSKFQ